MNTKNNRRAKETHDRIHNALLELLRTHTLRQINVRMICNHADINRSTFYAHYLDVNDLLEQTGKEMMDEMAKLFATSDDILDFFLSEKYMIQLIEYVGKHSDFFDVYLNYCDAATINEGFSTLWNVSAKPYIQRFGLTDEAEMWYHFTFFQAGFLAVISQWLKRGCVESPKQIVTIILHNLPESMTAPSIS